MPRKADRGREGKLTGALRWALNHAAAWRITAESGKEYEPAPPELMDGFGGWYEDFFDLSTDRQIGMVAGPIPKSSIDRHVAGWPHEEADMFRAVIRAMDQVYLEHGNGDGDKTPDDGISARDAFRQSTSGRRRG